MKKSKFTEQQIAFALRQPSAPSRLDGGLSRHGLLPIREPGLDCELAGRKLAAPLDGGHELAETTRVEAPPSCVS